MLLFFYYEDVNTPLDFKDDFAGNFSVWDENSDGIIDVLEVGARSRKCDGGYNLITDNNISTPRDGCIINNADIVSMFVLLVF